MNSFAMKLNDLRSTYPILIGLILWFLGPPMGLDGRAYCMFVIFISTIISLLIRVLPMATSVLIGLSIAILTNLIPLKKALMGFGDSTTWLVVIAFLIAGVIMETGLGRRISLFCIDLLGRSITGLGYALCASELILGPLVPSNTARGGGIIAPIVDSMSRALGSDPDDSPESAGQYLHLVGAHANLITAAMFLTGMAANPLVSRAAQDVFQIEFGWTTWALGGIIPGLVGLVGLPILMKYLSPPMVESIEPIRNEVRAKLHDLGPWSFKEKGTVLILASMLLLWITKAVHGWGTTTVALMGLVSILVLKVTSWDQLVKNHKAWDTLIWLGGLLTLATALKDLGFIAWFAQLMDKGMDGLAPLTLLLVLALVYFYSMYIFSMLTAHIVALAGAIFMVASNVDLDPYLVVGVIAYFSSLCGCLTNYSTGPIIIYFGNGYSSPTTWFRIGLLVSFYHLTIWIIVGSLWWKVIGWW